MHGSSDELHLLSRREFHPHPFAWILHPVTRTVGFVAIASSLLWMVDFVAARGAIAQLSPDEQLLAQNVVDGLPPPPGFGTAPVTPQVQVPALNAPAPTSGLSNTPISSDQYLVVVNGDSPLLLDQVRQVSSDAVVQTYQGQSVIQAGVFSEPDDAEEIVEALAEQGIGAEVAALTTATPGVSSFGSATPIQPYTTAVAPSAASTTSLPPPELLPDTVETREVEFGRSPDDATLVARRQDSDSENGYYLVVPGRSSDLQEIANQVIRLGGSFGVASVVDERSEPLGSHVLLGPFRSRSSAYDWNEYLRDFGLDSRVYYRR
jgi:hypothetical protein